MLPCYLVFLYQQYAQAQLVDRKDENESKMEASRRVTTFYVAASWALHSSHSINI